MTRKRNYKAEYARRKARAQARGYQSPREEYKARKAMGMTDKAFRRVSTPPRKSLPSAVVDRLTGAYMRRIRQACQEWSNAHSHVKASRFRATWSNKRVMEYYRAYVERPNPKLSRRKRAIAKRRAIYDYLVNNGFPVEGGPEDWKSDLAPA